MGKFVAPLNLVANHCVSQEELGKWFLDNHPHRGVNYVDCDATGITSLHGNPDVADFIFAKCPGALAPPGMPYRWRPLPPKNPNFSTRICTDPFFFVDQDDIQALSKRMAPPNYNPVPFNA